MVLLCRCGFKYCSACNWCHLPLIPLLFFSPAARFMVLLCRCVVECARRENPQNAADFTNLTNTTVTADEEEKVSLVNGRYPTHPGLGQDFKNACPKKQFQNICPSRFSQDFEASCPKLAVVKFLGISFFKEKLQCTHYHVFAY